MKRLFFAVFMASVSIAHGFEVYRENVVVNKNEETIAQKTMLSAPQPEHLFGRMVEEAFTCKNPNGCDAVAGKATLEVKPDPTKSRDKKYYCKAECYTGTMNIAVFASSDTDAAPLINSNSNLIKQACKQARQESASQSTMKSGNCFRDKPSSGPTVTTEMVRE